MNIESIERRLQNGSMPIPFSGCTIWFKASVPKGYGVIFHNKKQTYTHRVSYELNKGRIPDGMCVLHHCDTPSCINPEHLFLGTQKDNVIDCINKKRNFILPKNFGNLNSTRVNPKIVQGENNGMSKITWKIVDEIRTMHANKISDYDISKKYNISKCQVNKITRNKSWVI